jgi:hypothetical protein
MALTSRMRELMFGNAGTSLVRDLICLPVVNEYEIDSDTVFGFCDVLKFDEPNEIWLDFVCSCRDGVNVAKGRDFVFGPVANDVL